MKNKLLVICAVLLLFPMVCASNNFRINSTTGELFFVNGTSGNVGIGTTAPGQRLHINTVSANTYVKLETDDGYDVGELGYQGATMKYSVGYDDSSDTVALHYGNFDASGINIDNNGNLGIGTTNPNAKLYVEGNGGAIGSGFADDTSALHIASFASADTGTRGGVLRVLSTNISAEDSIVLASYGNPNTDLILATRATSGYVYPRMTIEGDGNVGIGTTSPQQKLNVVGDVNFTGSIITPTNISIGPNAVASGSNSISIGNSAKANETGVIAIGIEAQAKKGGVVSIGSYAGYQNTGAQLTAVGPNSGQNNSGDYLTAFGGVAGKNNNQNYVTSIGYQAGYENTGSSLTTTGYMAGWQNTGANVATFGYQAGCQNNGSDVTAIGYEAGNLNKASYLTATGTQAGKSNTGTHLTAIGYYAGYQNTKAQNTLIGYEAGRLNTGQENTFIGGFRTGYNNSGNKIAAVGNSAGKDNTGDESAFLGVYAGYQNTGIQSTATGYGAAYKNTGNYLTATGYYAGFQNTGGDATAIGYYASYKNTGAYLTAIGKNAAWQNTGAWVTALGYHAGYNNTKNYLTAVGHNAGFQNTGSQLTAMGFEAGRNNTGDDSVFIGYEAGENNVLDDVFILKQSVNAVPLIWGNFSSGNVGIGTGAPIFRLHLKSSGTSTAPFVIESSDGSTYIAYFAEDSAGSSSLVMKNGSGTIKTHIGTGNSDNTYFNGGDLYIKSNGNVGIGTTSPSHKLDVAGNISVNGTGDNPYLHFGKGGYMYDNGTALIFGHD